MSFTVQPNPDTKTSSALQKWGAFASFVLAVAFIVPPLIYLMGNLRETNGILTYALADFLYGPVWAASLVMTVYALRERIGERAPRLTSLALLAALLAAVMFVLVALLRSSNRNYHLLHPELHLEESQTVLIVWTTLIAGVIATGWHFLGWVFILLGSAAWTSGRLPKALGVLYLLTGTLAVLMYMAPENEGGINLFGMIISIWQGILLLRTAPKEVSTPKVNTPQPDIL